MRGVVKAATHGRTPENGLDELILAERFRKVVLLS